MAGELVQVPSPFDGQRLSRSDLHAGHMALASMRWPNGDRPRQRSGFSRVSLCEDMYGTRAESVRIDAKGRRVPIALVIFLELWTLMSLHSEPSVFQAALHYCYIFGLFRLSLGILLCASSRLSVYTHWDAFWIDHPAAALTIPSEMSECGGSTSAALHK